MNAYARKKLCRAIESLLSEGTVQSRVAHANKYLIILKFYENEIPDRILGQFSAIIKNMTDIINHDVGDIYSAVGKLSSEQEADLTERLLELYITINGGNLAF